VASLFRHLNPNFIHLWNLWAVWRWSQVFCKPWQQITPKKSRRNNRRSEPWCIGMVHPQPNSIMKLKTFFLTRQWHPYLTLVFTRIRLINVLPLSHHQIIHLCPSASHPSIPISFASCYWSMFLVISHPSNAAIPTSLPQLGAGSQIYSLNICGRNA
jgi:hypothetical protein